VREIRASLNFFQAGRRLSRDVYRDRNMLLMSKGQVLTEDIIGKLKNNGVIHVYLEEHTK
jgi:hypothetical protein